MVSTKITVLIFVFGLVATISAKPTTVREDAEKSEVVTTLRSVNDDVQEEGVVTTEVVVLADEVADVTTSVPETVSGIVQDEVSVDNVVAIKNVEKVVVIPVEKTGDGAEVVVVPISDSKKVVIPVEKTEANTIDGEKVVEVVPEVVPAVPLANVPTDIVSLTNTKKSKRSPQQWLNIFRRRGHPKGSLRRRADQSKMKNRRRRRRPAVVDPNGVNHNFNNFQYGHRGQQQSLATENRFGYGGFTGYED